MFDLLDKVLSGESTEEKIPLCPINEVIEYMKSLGFSHDYDANGYQVDFWLTFTRGGEVFELAGDLWYSEKYTFYKKVAE